MKTSQALITLSMCLTVTVLVGCDKTAPGTESGTPGKAPAQLGDEFKAAKPAAEQAVKAVSETANTAVAEATAKANTLIAQAQSLMGQSKYTEALNIVQQLSSLKLTPEQEKLVASLKDQIQKAMASGTPGEGTSAVRSLLKK